MSPAPVLRAAPPAPEPQRLVLTCEEVAAAFGISVAASRRLLAGQLRGLTRRVGKRRVIARSALTRWLEEGGGR